MEYLGHILLADDEPDILEILKYNLEANNYLVTTATNGEEAVRIAEEIKPDLIVLDVMMPVYSGFDACKKIKANEELENTPIIFLTALNDEENEVKGLNIGADDYIQKPIKPKLFISRINSIFRRIRKEDQDIIEFDNLKIDRNKFEVMVGQRSIQLAKKEFHLLYLLASQPQRVLLRDEILQKVWGNGVIVGERTIDVHIRKLRQKMGLNCIQTIKGVGYKFEIQD